MAAIVVLLVHVGLRPVRLAASHLGDVDARSLPHVNLEPRNVPTELTPFVDALAQMLYRLKEAMGRQKAFIADASHELRTPMTAAKSTIQTTLAARRSAGEYQQSLEETLEDLRRMEHLGDELLLLARIDEATDTPPDQPLEIGHLLAELADSFNARVAQTGGKLVCSLSPAIVAGDDRQIGRLFSNLLDNALRHGPKGGTIHLSSETLAQHVVITVHDDGGNIPAGAIPQLFERFFRVDGSRTSSTGGTGLGLAIAREIVIRHGGTIAITSQPASGTRVIVTLPLAHPPSKAK
jgi:two-component system heavy metal sensor histidine kinase CusS